MGASDIALRLADVLEQFMERIEWTCTSGLLSKRSGVPKATIVNWLEGRVARPRHWQDLVKVAAALSLDPADVNRLLKAAGYPSLDTIYAQTTNLEERALLELWLPRLPTLAASVYSLGATVLPQPLTRLIGRDRDVIMVRSLLQRADVRLLTLTGMGGSGKTRLALQVASDMRAAFADGVYWVSLAPMKDAGLVVATIATALGITATGTQPLLETLKEALGTRQLLLVLDNFEQVIAAAPLVAELLATAPRLKILITSRVVLRLSGEQEFQVLPLATPDPAAELSAEALLRYPAIALFVKRVQALRAGFTLTDENAPLVAAICARLDGLPLALELAAARSKLLSERDLLDRLNQRLDLLTDGPRDLHARQQSLRNTIAWSYNLLEPAAQTLFARLALFSGGCTLEAAEALTSDDIQAVSAAPATAPIVTHHSLLDLLTTLVDHSLLEYREAADGTRRFTMLETIREYALECLERSGEREIVRQRHAAYYLALAEQARPQLVGAEQGVWLTRLSVEHGNLNAALSWYLHNDVAGGVRLAYALYYYWEGRGHITEGRRWVNEMLALLNEPDAARALALDLAGTLAYKQGDDITAQIRHEESVTLRKALQDRAGVACSLNILGHVARSQGYYTTARAYYEQSLAIRHERGDQHSIALSLDALGQVLVEQGDLERAAACYAEGLAIKQARGDRLGASTTLRLLGDLAYRQGDARRADTLYHEALQITRELGMSYPEGSAWLLYNLGQVARARGEVSQATKYFQESLALFRRLEVRQGIARCLAGLDGVAPMQRLVGSRVATPSPH